ncbi:MAG TPA: hypothetical protein VHV83_11755, partial [Armatimonadota bacterium]|nr:hypothetical protein [Armatimonadota bacterium]
GIVLMLTQFPGIDAVQFTFAGVKRDAPFMRGNLNAPISSMQLLLPPLAAKPANRQTAEIIRRAIPVDQEENELTFCSTLIWQDWAMVTTTSRSYLLERQDETYTVRFADNELQAKELLIRKVPSDVIIAFRISGWQDLER